MKQIPYILTAAVLTLCLTSCGRSAPIAAVTTETTSETVPIVTTTPVETTQAAEIPTEFTIPEAEPVKEEAVSADAVSPGNIRQESSSAGSAQSVTHTSGTSSVTHTSGTSIEETKPIPATTPSHTHQYSKSVTKPGCTSEGFTTYICSCGDTYPGDFVPASGHSWGGWEITKEPTVSTTGNSRKPTPTPMVWQQRFNPPVHQMAVTSANAPSAAQRKRSLPTSPSLATATVLFPLSRLTVPIAAPSHTSAASAEILIPKPLLPPTAGSTITRMPSPIQRSMSAVTAAGRPPITAERVSTPTWPIRTASRRKS